MNFPDHFSQHAANYANARPGYPAELFAFLAAQCQARLLAWDCATGNGQAAIALAAHFDRVIATDASQQQLDAAVQHEKVEYRCALAEESPLPAAAADLITVAQALHWFDIGRFFDTAQLVLKPGGLLAVWSYELTSVSPAVDAVVQYLYNDVIGPYWPPERRLVERAYADIPFPFDAVPAPTFKMQCLWTQEQLLDYLLSWSATRRYMAAEDHNPLDLVRTDLRSAWGNATVREVNWPLALHLRRK